MEFDISKNISTFAQLFGFGTNIDGRFIMNEYVEQLKRYFENTPESQVEKDFEELSEFDNVGPLLDDYIDQVLHPDVMRITYESIPNPEFSLDFL